MCFDRSLRFNLEINCVHRLFFCSFRQSQTISAQRAAVSVAAGTAIGSQLVIAFHKTHEAVPYMRTAEAYAKTDRFYVLILSTGILPAGLMLRVFILNSLIRIRFISVDSIVSNSDAPARSLKILC